MLFRRFKKKDKFVRGLVESALLQYYMERREKVNIISFLGNKRKIFNNIINAALKENKKILYITNEVYIGAEILSKFRINILKNDSQGHENLKVNICTSRQALYFKGKFDLIIYDDINSYPLETRENIEKIMKRLICSYGTMIAYSMEPVFDNEIILYCAHENYLDKPVIEPRIITTRLDIKEDIPMVVCDYLIWSSNCNSNMVIYVPTEEKVEILYTYLLTIADKLTSNIFKNTLYVKNKNEINKFLNKSKSILITNDFNVEYAGLKALNIMIFFADDVNFDYKKLVYLTSKVKMESTINRQEAIFLCNEENRDIENAKNILRELNKRAWDEGALKL